MNYSRKKPSSQSNGGYSNNGQQRSGKQRFSHGGGGGQNHGGGNRQRKNYGAMREKYLTQARDALASGDRVLAENYFQHADHCFRMIAEENASRPQRFNAMQEQNTEEMASETATDGDDSISTNVSSLPAFLTGNYEPPKTDGEPI